MDVSNILASHAEKFKSITVEKENPLETDPGLLTVTDPNPIDEESYNENLEEHLQSLARDGVQALFAELFSLPVKQSPDGPLAQLPPPKTLLPRSKPLPKPKAKTKWEMFAAAKGISHKKREKKVWDEEKQDWVNRWGRDGKNKEKEDQWLSEVPLNADADFDPRKAARDERKERIAKNQKQHAQNVARSMSAAAASAGTSDRDGRKRDIERTLATTRMSTASMGKFDKKLEGEKKLRGVKRKFEPTEASAGQEAKASLALLSRIDSDARKMRKVPAASDEGVLNVRKAVRFASKGRGAHSLARGGSSKSSRGKRGGKR